MTEHKLPRPPADTPALYAQDGKGYDAVVHAHYFVGANDWLVTEYDPDEDIAFGWARINGDDQNAELGYISLAELESVRVPITVRVHDGPYLTIGQLPGGAAVELERPWRPATIRDAIRQLNADRGR